MGKYDYKIRNIKKRGAERPTSTENRTERPKMCKRKQNEFKRRLKKKQKKNI